MSDSEGDHTPEALPAPQLRCHPITRQSLWATSKKAATAWPATSSTATSANSATPTGKAWKTSSAPSASSSTASLYGTPSTSTSPSNSSRAAGHQVLDADIARLSPYLRRHINVHGHYSFQPPDPTGRYRALGDPDLSAPDVE